jgi:hypothetical protein
MKKYLIPVGVTMLLGLIWSSCQKDTPALPSDSSGGVGASAREEEENYDAASVSARMSEIGAYKTKFDRWRQGQNTSQTIDAAQAVEEIESIFNFYLSRPGKSYGTDQVFVDEVVIPTSSLSWNGSRAAYAFEQVKAKLVAQFATLANNSKGVRMVDLGSPVVSNGQIKIAIHAEMGSQLINSPTELDALTIRWAGPPVEMSTECAGAANEGIGQAVNANLGFFLQNLPPFSTVPPGNPLVNPDVLILSPIRSVQTNATGSVLPGPPPAFVANTTNYPSGNNQAPNYPNIGQYKIHYDLEFSTPCDEICFSLGKFGAYVLGNRQVGDSHTAMINQMFPTPSFFPKYRLICTYVSSASRTAQIPGGYVDANEHPTWHYYGRILFVAGPDVPVPVCCPEVM